MLALAFLHCSLPIWAAEFTSVSAASYAGPVVAPGSLVSGFGIDLATSTETAQKLPLPTDLGGVQVIVTDRTGHAADAPLLFVSPTQINYVLPEGLASGEGTVQVTGTPRGTIEGTITVGQVAPALFSAGSSGFGVAAAQSVQLSPGEVQRESSVWVLNPFGGSPEPKPILWRPAVDKLYLVLYGTGIRHASAVSATVNGHPATVAFYGPHGDFVGLDQVNVEVPVASSGEGIVSILITADSLSSNAVTVELAPPFSLNFGFEAESDSAYGPMLLFANGYEAGYSTEDAYSGIRSFRLKYTPSAGSSSGSVSWRPETSLVRGRHASLKAMVRAGGDPNAEVSLYWGEMRNSRATAFASEKRMVSEVGQWTEITLERNVDGSMDLAEFGVSLRGDGTMWCDNVELSIDGVPVGDGPALPLSSPTPTQIFWLDEHAHALQTVKAGSGFGDLEAFRQMVGDARVVALGESTHGTAEFFQLKHRLVEFLASEMGFTIFAIEANLPESRRLNDYVLRGEGNPATLLAGLMLWPWNTQEMLDLIRWMRSFNMSGRGTVQFTGFDAQSASGATDSVLAFLQSVDPTLRDLAWQAYLEANALVLIRSKDATAITNGINLATNILQTMESRRSTYLQGSTNEEVEQAIQDARVVVQALTIMIEEWDYRDWAMAQNAEWIIDHAPPGSKVVIWAHDLHVGRRDSQMGRRLAARFGNEYLPVSLMFESGNYNAYASGVKPFAAVPPVQGSVENTLSTAAAGDYYLDLRSATVGSEGEWLRHAAIRRAIGAPQIVGFFLRQSLLREYDAVFFIRNSSPSTLLPFN